MSFLHEKEHILPQNKNPRKGKIFPVLSKGKTDAFTPRRNAKIRAYIFNLIDITQKRKKTKPRINY